MNVSYDTIKRHDKQPIYETKEYILHNNIEVLNKSNSICTKNVIQTKQTERIDNISKYNDLPQKHRVNKAKEHDLPSLIGNIECDLF